MCTQESRFFIAAFSGLSTFACALSGGFYTLLGLSASPASLQMLLGCLTKKWLPWLQRS